MAIIRIVDAWLRSPAAAPTSQRAVMVIADSWSEQRVLMRAYAESPDQTRPTIVLHGQQLAIGPAGTDPHGSWGIHVEPPVDGRAQELREQLLIAARRLAGSKGNPPRLLDESPTFDRKRTNNWAPGTPPDLPDGAGNVDSSYYEPSLLPVPPGASPGYTAGPSAATVAPYGAQQHGSPAPLPGMSPVVPGAPPPGPPPAAPPFAPHGAPPPAAPPFAPHGAPPPAAPPFAPHGAPPPAAPPFAPHSAAPPPQAPLPSVDDEKTLPGPVPAPLLARVISARKPAHTPEGASADGLLPDVSGLGHATSGGSIANPAYSGQRAAANAPLSRPGAPNASPRGWSSPVQNTPPLRDQAPSGQATASSPGHSRKGPGAATITGFASGASLKQAAGKRARSAGGFASMVDKTMPVGFQLSGDERTVLDALAENDALPAQRIGELVGTPDGASWMADLMTKLASYGLDLIAVFHEDGQTIYKIQR